MPATIDFTQYRGEDVSSTKRRMMANYTGPASYVAGGDPFTPGDVKLGNIDTLLFEIAVNAAHTVFYYLRWNKTAQKVIWLVGTTGVEAAGAVDLSGFTARFEAIGT